MSVVHTGWLKNKNGEKVSPNTYSSQVIEYDGTKLEDRLKEKVSSPITAEVGQQLIVKEVDENGKPIEWECVERPCYIEENAVIIDEIVTLKYKTTEGSGFRYEPESYISSKYALIDNQYYTITLEDNVFTELKKNKFDFNYGNNGNNGRFTINHNENEKKYSFSYYTSKKFESISIHVKIVGNAAVQLEECFIPKDLSSYVKSTDYATSSEAGIVMVSSDHGVFMSGTLLSIHKASSSDITSRTDKYRPIVPSNLDFAVKTSLSSNKLTLTDSEKQSARNLIGAISEEALLQFAIKPATEKAVMLNIQDSAEYRVLDLEMDGKTEQFTTRGVNLWNLGDVEVDTFEKISPISLSAGTYTISANVESSDTDSTICLVLFWYAGTTNSKGISLNRVNRASGTVVLENDVDSISFYSSNNMSNATGDTATFKDIQIEPGSTATDYEPYTGGTASPNPDYPQEIVNAGIYNEETGRYEIEIKFTGRNLWNPESTDYVQGLYRGWKVKNDDAQYMTITLIDKNNGADISGVYFGVTGTGIHVTGGVIWLVEYGEIKKTTLTTKYNYITIFTPNDETLQKVLDRFDVMVEYGTAATEYEPYKEQLITLSSDRPLTKWDKLVKRDGAWGWSIWHDSTEDFATLVPANAAIYGSEGKYMPGIKLPNAEILNYKHEKLMTEVGRWGGTKVLYQPRIYDKNVTVYVADDDTVESAKEHLHYKAQWQTDTEQSFILLPDEEQAALNALMTYHPVTIVTNDQDCPMQLTYVADTKKYIDNKLLEIQSAML